MAEQFRAPSERLVPLPAGPRRPRRPLVEPASVSWHALRLAGTGPGKRVAVVGGGALGLLAAAGARRMGAEDVAVEARHPHQQEATERLGARVGTDAGYDVVVEAAGRRRPSPGRSSWSGRTARSSCSACTSARSSSTGCRCSTARPRVVPSLGYCRHEGGREMDEAAAMLAADPEIARTLITHRFPIEDAAEAFRVAGERSSGAIRVVIEP